MSKNIAAILKRKKLKTYWGFKFDTNIQSHVENFMLESHYGTDQYFLSHVDEAPEGVYTEVQVTEILDKEKVVGLKFTFELK